MNFSATRSSAASQLASFQKPLALGAGADQRLHQPVGMVDAVGIARDLGADDARRVAVVLGAMDAADAVVVEELDVERAGGRAVVRAGRMADLGLRVAMLACWFMPPN